MQIIVFGRLQVKMYTWIKSCEWWEYIQEFINLDLLNNERVLFIHSFLISLGSLIAKKIT